MHRFVIFLSLQIENFKLNLSICKLRNITDLQTMTSTKIRAVGCYLYCFKKRGTHWLNGDTQGLDIIPTKYNYVLIFILYPSYCVLYFDVWLKWIVIRRASFTVKEGFTLYMCIWILCVWHFWYAE